MKTNKKYSLVALAALMILTGSQLFAHSSAAKSPSGHDISPATRSVQVDQVDPGDVDIERAFRVAIYENLLVELAKTRQFKQVFRSGDRDAGDIPDLLVLKTTVQRYTPGSETRRAVTTVAGATKLNVRTQLSTRQGQVVLERVVNGNVRFFGGNLRATHNLARNVAGGIKQSPLPGFLIAPSSNLRPIG
jgi:hypothetical protein